VGSELVSEWTEQKERSNPFDAVMDVLRLGQRAESVLPNKLIRQIMVDREIGITIYAFNKIKEIKLGYENYADKYDLPVYMKHNVLPFWYSNQRKEFPKEK